MEDGAGRPLCCCINGYLMRDPVFSKFSGQGVYERETINRG